VKYVGPAGTAGYDAVGNVLAYQYIDNTGRVDQYETTYEMKDGYLESATTGTSSGLNVRPTTDESYYDDRGNRIAIAQHTQYGGGTVADTVRVFSYDGNGEILTRRDGTANGSTIDQGSNASHENQHYAYVNGQQVAHWDEGGTVDVLSEVTAFSNSQSGTSGYVVQAGDTLKSMAQAIYGDANLWYVIAAANSLSSDNDLSIGQNLTIPQVTTNSNDATTFKPYNASQISGSTTPSLPTIAPPPPPTSQHCNVVAAIIVIAVEIVVTYFTGNPVVGNLAGQVAGNILGVQDGVNYKSLAVAAISEGVSNYTDSAIEAENANDAANATATVGSDATEVGITSASTASTFTFGEDLLRGAIQYTTDVVASKLVGAPTHFSWAGFVADSAGYAAGEEFGTNLRDSKVSSNFAGNVASVATTDVVDRELGIALGDDHVPSWKQIGIDVGGAALGNAAAAGLSALGVKPVNINQLVADSFKNSAPTPTQPATTLGVNGVGYLSGFGSPNGWNGAPGATPYPDLLQGQQAPSMTGSSGGDPNPWDAATAASAALYSANAPQVAANGWDSTLAGVYGISSLDADGNYLVNPGTDNREPLQIGVNPYDRDQLSNSAYQLPSGTLAPYAELPSNGQFANPGLQPFDVALTNTLSGVSASAEPLYGVDLLQADANGPSPDLGLPQANLAYLGNQGIPGGISPALPSIFSTALLSAAPQHYEPGFRPNEPSTLNTIYDYTKAQADALAPVYQALSPGSSEIIEGIPRVLADLGNVWGSFAATTDASGVPEGTNPVTNQSILAGDIKNTQQNFAANLIVNGFTGGAAFLEEGAASSTLEQQAWKTFLGTAGSEARVTGELSPQMLGYDGAANSVVPLMGKVDNALIRETGDQSIDFAAGRADATVPNTIVDAVEGPTITAQPGYQLLYRGTADQSTQFLSDVATTQGVDASNAMIANAQNEGSVSYLFENHAATSQGSPYISLSSSEEVAQFFARGPGGNQSGFVNVFQVPYNFAEPNFENANAWEREYLAPTQIPDQYLIHQYQVMPQGKP